MKLNKKVLNSSLVVLLALGLGGCAANSATTTHKSHDVQSAQVVKQNHKKADNKTAAKASSNEQAAASSNSTSASAISKQSSSQAASSYAVAASANTRSANASAVATPKAAQASAVSSVKENQNIQLGLGDVASWTDAKGVTHHVDSDGMDRYTTKGSSQVQYQDWSGQLPSNAVVSHH